MARRFGLKMDPGREIASTIGSKEAVFHLHEGLINPGDVVISPSPGYPPYSRGTLFAEGESWFYPLTQANGFLPDLDAVPRDVRRRAKLLWVCYPNSPTGAVASRRDLERIVAFGRENGIVIASDEAYIDMYFTPEPPPSILNVVREGVVAVFSLSKRSAMTCYRVGWVAGDSRVIDIFKKVKTNIDSGTATFIQDGAVAALADEKHVDAFREEYRRKRDILVRALTAAGLPDCTPQGTIYLWQRVPQGITSVQFATRLLDPEIAVVTTPGAWISTPTADGQNPGEGYVRFAFVPSIEDTRRAADKLASMKF
jgi:LL-diaminopimelate aminotransferase